MISLPINEVTDTNIFVALDDKQEKQLTIYSNLIDNVNELNAMVIPIPHPQSVQFYDMSSYKNFFSDCDKSFKLQSLLKSRSETLSMNDTFSTNSYGVNKTIAVQTVGSYKVSVANNIAELENLDKNVFILSDELKIILNKHYGTDDWGFIAFILSTGRNEYHPFAFSHNLLNGQIYVPTRHYHNHLEYNSNTNNQFDNNQFDNKLFSYDASNIDQSPMFSSIFTSNRLTKTSNNTKQPKHSAESKQLDQTMTDDWSHKIYLYNIMNDSNIKNDFIKRAVRSNTYYYKWNRGFSFDKSKFNGFDMNNHTNFTKIDIKGLHPNNDIMINV